MGTREVSAVAAGLLALVATALVAAPDRVAAAEPVGGTIRGTVYDADDPADPTAADVQTKLYRWNVATSSFAPADAPTVLTEADGRYGFAGLVPGCYTVRFADTSMTYVAETWPTSTGTAPTATTTGPGTGVVEVPDPDDPAQCNATAVTAPPVTGTDDTPREPQDQVLDVTLLKQLVNEGAQPDVTGYRHVGYRLAATPGGWNVPVDTLTFTWQWQRVDSAGIARDIAGATGPSYLLTASDVGNGVRVRATAYRSGYAPESGYSDETEVAKGYSSTGLRLAYSRIHATGRGRVRVSVTPSSLPPTGTVTVKVDGRRRVSTTLTPAQAGSVPLLLPRLARGKHRVVATYAGSRGLYASTSRPLTLTVIR